MAQTEAVVKRGGKKNAVGDFYINKVNGDVMKKYIAKKKLDIDTDDVSDEQIAVGLFAHFDDLADENKVKCDNCDGVSSDADDSCPYCGEEGAVEDDEETAEASSEDAETEEEAEADEEEEKPAAKAKKAKKDEEEEETEDSSDDEDEEESEEDDEEESDDSEDEDEEEETEASEDEEEEKPAPKKAAKVKAKKKDEDEEEDDETVISMTEEEIEAVAPTPKKRRGRPKGSKNKKEVTNGLNGSAKHSTALVKAPKADLVAAKELDKAVADFFKIKSDGAENFWRMGQKLAEINKKQLWKLRHDEDGKQRYKSWEAFVHAELKMSPQHAYRAIEIAKGYSTAEEVRELGHTKASLLLNAAPEDRPKLKDKAKAGATKRELEEDVKKSREKHGAPKTSKKALAGKKGGAARAKKLEARSEKVSIATLEGTKTIKLYKKPETLADFDPSKAPRATSLKDGPFGFFEMANGVMQYYHIFLKDGELFMKIQTARQK